MQFQVNRERTRLIKDGVKKTGPVAYWMSRDQRAEDNWALLSAWESSLEKHSPLVVFFCLMKNYLRAETIHYDFMLRGLKEVEKELARLRIPFYLLKGSPEEVIPDFIEKHSIAELFTDFDPLRMKKEWKEKVANRITIPVWETDAHNILPCWVASVKQEFGAYTFRPKIKKLLPGFMDTFPRTGVHPYNGKLAFTNNNWKEIGEFAGITGHFTGNTEFTPGETAAEKALWGFIEDKLDIYAEKRNDPNSDAQSNLSPYLHFGQLSAQRAALEIMKAQKNFRQEETFLEELIVRRELSDNFCHYNADYDRFEGFPRWCRETLDIHRGDRREFIYPADRMENADTHDKLWNAAQNQMRTTGKMHGYLRMYWAKKILEWTESPEQAIETAIYLNDKYELDGRDPNGYTGIAWSIGGTHDRPWKERAIFGKIRYMSYGGCNRKFDIELLVERYNKK